MKAERGTDLVRAVTHEKIGIGRLFRFNYNAIRLAALLACDLAAILSAVVILGRVSGVSTATLWILAPLTVFLASCSLAVYGLYRHQAKLALVDQIPRILPAITLVPMCLAVISSSFAGFDIDVPGLAVFWLTALAATILFRVPAIALDTVLRRNQIGLKRTLIVGAGTVGTLVATKLGDHPEYGFNVVGFVDKEPPVSPERDSIGKLVSQQEDQLREIIDIFDITHVIIAFSLGSYERSLTAIRQCENMPVDFSVVPRLFEAVSSKATVEEVVGIPLVRLAKLNPGGGHWLVKRVTDLIGAVALLVLAAPAMAILAAVIRLSSPGPALFKQTRIGKDSRPFTFYKFRTMYIDARERFPELYSYSYQPEQISLLRFKLDDDPRLTSFGRFLRRTSLDELPNLFNVIRGDMSLVGPRPDIPEMIQYYRPDQLDKLRVRPGVTGMAQVSGRGFLTFQETLDFDVNYARNQSLLLDTQILLKTLVHVLRGVGAF